MKFSRLLRRLAAYLWAAPNTVLGGMAGLAVVCLGGGVRRVQGVVEFHGGLAGRLLTALPGLRRFGAMTLGHVILGVSPATLDAVRRHEQVHVRQYERWGPFFLPAYLISSLWQLLRGRRAYWDNSFEREAYERSDEE